MSVPNSKSEPKQSPLPQLLLCNKPGPVSASITGLLPGTAGGLESLASRVWPYGRVGGWVAGWVVEDCHFVSKNKPTSLLDRFVGLVTVVVMPLTWTLDKVCVPSSPELGCLFCCLLQSVLCPGCLAQDTSAV